MEKFHKIKKKIGLFFLKQNIKKQNRNIEFNNIDSAQSIGIIFNADDESEFPKIKKFISQIKQQNKNVYGLGFVGKEDDNLIRPQIDGIEYFSFKNLTWFYKPKDAYVSNFCNKAFDLLIDLNLDDYCLPLSFVSVLSNSKCKIGKKKLFYSHDIFIDIKDNNSAHYLISQIQHYLSVLKTGTKGINTH